MIKQGVKQHAILAIGMTLLLVICAASQTSAYEVTLSLYNQGFNINNFYNDGDFDVEAGIVEADPSSLLVIVGDPANVEETLEIPEIPDPFALADAGSDFHFEEFQPFRFQDRFDGLFSTTVDDPVLFVPDNGTVTAFRDDGLLADDRIDLDAYEAELPPMYVEVDYGDTITMTTYDGTKLFITQVWRNPDFTVTFHISDVPEPGTLLLIGFGLLGLFGIIRRKKMMYFMKKKFSLLMIPLVILSLIGAIGVFAEADEIEDTIMQKWQNMRDNGIDIGEPTREVVGAWGSPYGTGGYVRFFENGDIYYHGNGPRTGQAFEVHGRIYGTYNREGGTGSFLGFPISDEKPNGPYGHPVSYFEGGCITSENGIDYDIVIEGCTEAQPPQPPKLESAECRDCCIQLENAKHSLSEDEFNLNFVPYTPRNYNLTFNPETVQFPLSDRTMTRDVTVRLDTGAYGSVETDVTIVNPDISWDMSPLGFDLKFKKKMKEMTKALDTIEETTNKFKRFDLATCETNWQFDPSLSFGFEGSKLCCPATSDCIKDGLKMYVDFSADFGPISCDIPVFPLPFGFRANLAFDAGIGASLGLAKEPSCNSHDDLCGKVEAKFDVGLGASLTDITGGKLLKGSLKGKPNPSFGAKVCTKTNDLLAWRFKEASACIDPKVVGEVKIASFIKKSISLSIGGKRCKTWE